MGTKHTSGPWKASASCAVVSEASTGRTVAEIVMPIDAGERPLDVEECAANALLIAAAPDLLEACKAAENTMRALINAHESEPFRPDLDPASRFQQALRNSHGLLRAAIATAGGAA